MLEELEQQSQSMMSVTGRNAAYALGLSLGVGFVFALAYTFMSVIADSVDGKVTGIWILFERILGFFQVTGVCISPIVFIISFALLQRLKIKY